MSLDRYDDPVTGDALTPEELKSIFRHHPGGVTLVAVPHDEGPRAYTASSVISVSADPPMVAFSVDTTSSFFSAVEEADSVAVSFLTARQDHVARAHAHRTPHPHQRPRWTKLPTGESVVTDGLAWLQGRITQRVPVGSSQLIIVHVSTGEVGTGEPLVYFDRRYHAATPLGTDETSDNVTRITFQDHRNERN